MVFCAAAAVLFACSQLGVVPRLTIAPGLTMPYVVLGTGSGQKGNVTSAAELWFTSTAGQGVDTAFDYDDESDLARGIAAAGVARGSIFIQTKVPCGTAAQAQSDFDANLQQLGVATVDLTLIHYGCGTTKDTWRVLEAMLAAGRTRAIGVSNFAKAELATLLAYATTVPAVNQNSLSVEEHDEETLAYCQEHNIVNQAFSPLCGGANGSSCSRHGGTSVLTIREVVAIAAAHNVSAAQVGLKWIIQRGFPLTTAVWRSDYMREDIDLWSWGNLTTAEMATLSALQPKR